MENYENIGFSIGVVDRLAHPALRFMELSLIIIPSVNCEIHDLYRKFLAVTRVGPEFVADRIGRLRRKGLGRVGCCPGGLIVESLPRDRRLGGEL